MSFVKHVLCLLEVIGQGDVTSLCGQLHSPESQSSEILPERKGRPFLLTVRQSFPLKQPNYP